MTNKDRTLAQDLTPTRAIIDIGSNTVRLVIYGGPPRAPTVLHNEKVSAKLGRGVAETGRLAEKAVRVSLAALRRYRALLDLRAIRRVDVVATAAARDAADGAEFLDRVRAIGFEPRLLTGEEEAIASATGVIGAFPAANGVVADLGGGSLELVDVEGTACRHGVSLPLGTLRLPPLRAKGGPAFARHVARILAAEDWSAPHSPTLYLVGGSFRSFARYAMQHGEWPSDDPHGFDLDAGAAVSLARTLARKRADALVPVPGIGSSRLGTLPDAAALLEALIHTLKPSRLVFSSWGLREGLLYASLPPGVQRQDPLLAGVSAFVEHHGVAPATAAMVAGWTAPANPANANGGRERLRLAATMLALASVNVEPNLRTDLSVAWAMRKRWIGITNRDRAMIAAALMANTGRMELPPAWAHFATTDELHEAQGWGLAVRLCRRLTGATAQSLSRSALRADAETLNLMVRAPYDVLVNEGVERDLRALGAHLGIKTACQLIRDAAPVSN